MLQQISTTVIFILVIWSSYTSTQNNAKINQLHAQLITQKQQQSAFQKGAEEHLGRLTQLDTMSVFISKQQHAEQQLQHIQTALVQQQQITQLTHVYADLLNAELQQQVGNLSDAATLLTVSKEGIWKAGDIYPSHKAALQGLMQPIDESLQQWKVGNPQSIRPIYQTVSATLQAITGNQ